MRTKKSVLLALLAPALVLAGCATASGPAPQSASSSGLSAGNMKLSVQMSSSIFLQPVSSSKRTVFVSGHNTSGAQGLSFTGLIKKKLLEKGYTIANDPAKAQYMLMYNVLYVGKQNRNYTAVGALGGSFGGALIGAAAGGNDTTTLAGALTGAVAGGIVGDLLSQNRYMMVVDIQLEQRQTGTYTKTSTNAAQGTASTVSAYNSGVRNWMIYRDRIVGQAKGTGLMFDYATPAMSKEVAGEISGIF